MNFSDPFGLCPEANTGRKCSLGDVLRFKVSFGGQAGYSVTAGPLTSTLRAQLGPVGEITVGKNVTNPLTISDNEVSIGASVTALGHGGSVKLDMAASDGERFTAETESRVAGGEVGRETVQRSRSTGKVGLKAGVGIMFGFEINYRALLEVVAGKFKE